MNCSFVQLLEDRFRQQLWDVVSEAIKEDNARGLPVKIRTVNIRYIDTAVLLQCEDYAKFPTILSVETSCTEDGCTYRRAMDISCTISGTFSKFFEDFRIYGLKIMKSPSCRKNDSLSEMLLPPMNREQMEMQAMRLINKGYGYSYHVYGTQKISPLTIAKALGIRIFFVRLSEDSSVRGVYVMEDTRYSMAIKKNITIDGIEVPFKASAAVPRLYRLKFRRDIYKDFSALKTEVTEGDESKSEIGIESLEVFENIAYIMAKHADPENVPDNPDDFLEQFNTFSIYEILPQLIELWGLNTATQVASKKNIAKLTAR